MMRALAIRVLSITCTSSAMGCVERDPITPNDVVVVATAPAPPVCATPVVPVTLTDGELAPAADAPDRRPGTRLRDTVSLGYAGDGKLTEIPRASSPWQGEDHPSIAAGHYVGYGSSGYGAYGHGRSGRGPVMPSSGGGGGHTGGSNLVFSPHIHSPGGGSRPGGSVGGGGGRPSGGRAPR